MKTQTKLEHTPKLSFDGHGFNDANSEHRERISTLSDYGKSLPKEYHLKIERACNAHEELLEACKAFLAFSYESFKTREEGDKEALRIRQIVKEAIAKAEGK